MWTKRTFSVPLGNQTIQIYGALSGILAFDIRIKKIYNVLGTTNLFLKKDKHCRAESLRGTYN